MKKKLFSLILATVLIGSLLAGCGGGDAASGEPVEINIQFVGLHEENTSIPDIEEALNAITVPEINVKVNIEPLFIGQLATTTSLGIAGGEKMDIVTVGLTNPISTMVAGGMLMPLDDLLESNGQDAMAATANVAEAQKIDGVTYGVTGYTSAAVAGGFVYNKDMAEKYGIEMHDLMTMEELTAAGEILKANGIKLTSFAGSSELNFKFYNSIESYGQSGAYGVIMDPANSTKIENVFATEEFAAYCEQIKEWNDAGYLTAEQLTDTTTVQQYLSQQEIFGTSSSYTPSQIASWTNPDFETGIVQMTEGVSTTAGAIEFMLGIASTCENPEAAMDFINLLYSNAEVANLMQYGIEGQDYVAVEGTENVITTAGTPNEDLNGYYTRFAHFGDPDLLKIVSPLTDSLYEDRAAFDAASKKSKSFGYSFDASAFSAEAGAIASVMLEYMPTLNAGEAADLEKELEDFNAALVAAGINDIIEANQEQLDAYLAGN